MNLCKVPERAVEYLLHSVFSVFGMPAYLHAEGVDRVLQQADGLIDSFRSISAQEVGQLGSVRVASMGVLTIKPSIVSRSL